METGQPEDSKVTLESVKKMIAERDEIDREIAKEEEILKMNNIDMKKSLVDQEGYPITSVDVYSVRRARNAIICAQNDRRKLTYEIEKAMQTLHQQQRNCLSACSENEGSDENLIVHRTSNTPFVRISKITNDSPAFEAGLKEDDLVIQFDRLHADNFKNMNELTDIVQKSINYNATNLMQKSIRVTVLRNNRPIRLNLVPQIWSGKGVLGCAVIPISSATSCN
ncbi:unnamed protein product [Thelazia callipaeda]|uniref:Nas2_N domain-containing protein n=1 Tax=Thelazia callipaeda TaxID=103827 RepID=A0A0N5CUD8_THECL|nr:unnamed protein product [Thelazia callipaeda]